jgi:hypothetical protein
MIDAFIVHAVMESSTDKSSLLVQASRNRDISIDPPCPVREAEGSRAVVRMVVMTEEIPDNRGLSLSLMRWD